MKRNTMNRNTLVLAGVALLAGIGLTLWAINKKNEGQEKAPTAQAASSEFTTSPEGIKYRIEKKADGRKPAKGDRVEVHYTGWLDVDGKEGAKFDSSVDRNQPFVFPVGMRRVIPGWDITVADMNEGEVRYIILPPELGYGSMSMGAKIPANSTLRFRVELLKIV